MMEQLGITKLRPGRNGAANATNNPANYDPAKANPFPDYPELLTLKNGQKVTTAERWWKQRRPEIVADFEREVIGRVPKDVPTVTWTTTTQATDRVGREIVRPDREVANRTVESATPGPRVERRERHEMRVGECEGDEFSSPGGHGGHGASG